MESILAADDFYREIETKYHPNFRAFGRKAIKLSANQKTLLDNAFPPLSIPFRPEQVDLSGHFSGDGPLHLEIGFGNGEYTDLLAETCKGHRIVACEIFLNGIASLLQKITEKGHENIRIVHGNALLALEKMFAAGTFDYIHINHPDPWPKKRHAKRRLIQPHTVPLFERALKCGGEVWLSTDAADYFDWMETCFDGAEGLARLPAEGRFLDSLRTGRAVTRFEEKGLRHGRDTRHLRYRKR